MTVCSASKVQQMERSPKTQSCQQSADLCKGKEQYKQLMQTKPDCSARWGTFTSSGKCESSWPKKRRERKKRGKERKGEKGGKKNPELCQWTECTIKTGVTTKVRADLTVNTVSGVESGKGGSFGEKEILWYFGMLEGWMWKIGGWGSNYPTIIGG